ncbi:MAG: TolC family protein [Phycisphaerales bacterium]
MRNNGRRLPQLLLTILLVVGCRSYDGDKIRREHAEEYPQALQIRTEEILSQRGSLGLEDCIRIALANSLQVKSSEIQRRIARLERKTAFANFLPTVDLNYQYTAFDPQLVRSISGFEAAMSDKRVREVTWQIQTSIFNPATWFLYSMHSRGKEIADLVTEYTRQMTVVQITACYFYCLSLDEYERALDSQIKAATALQEEVAAFYKEGLVTEWQARQVAVMTQARQIELRRTIRTHEQAKAELLTAMGLSPMADITLRPETPLEPAEGSLATLIAEALLHHPQLQISDRKVAIEEEKVKMAVSSFLPVFVGFASRMDSSDSFLKYSNYWTGGLAGTLSIFDGFANVNEYKAAKERRKDSYLEREQATMTIILEVIRAHLALETVKEEVTLAQSTLDVAAKQSTETQQKWREGLVSYSDMADVLAAADKARMQSIIARFQYQVSTATLLNAMGQTKTDYEETRHDGQSEK